MTWQEALIWGRNVLRERDIPDSDIDAGYLLEEVLQIDRNDFLLRYNENVGEEEWDSYQRLIERRGERLPLQYLIGKTEFMGLLFFVNEKVLIPRQETECLVEEIIPLAKKKRVLDLCTGSGCIGICIAVFEKSAEVFCSDISIDAIRVAEKNAHVNNAVISFLCGDLFESVSGTYDIIVSNPPYIKTEEISGLMPEVKNYEPVLALDGKEDGLYFYREIIGEAGRFLNKDGILAFEVGYDQGKKVSEFMKESGFLNVEVKKDLAGYERMVFGTYSGK